MKLFGAFEAVKFPEENLLFVTHNGFLYYIYSYKSNRWQKYHNSGNDSISVENYPDISEKELLDIMGGAFPTKETDFLRRCDPSEINVSDMLSLLKEDYGGYMSEGAVYHAVHTFLMESDICHKSYEKIRELLDNAIMENLDAQQVTARIIELSQAVTGRDIFKKEIGIIDGHNSSSYFWINPVKVVDPSDTNAIDSVAEMTSVEISIEEDDVDQYLTPFLFKYFDEGLEPNKNRIEYCYDDEDGNERASYVTGFEWYLTHNFYTYDSIEKMLADIKDTIDALSTGRETEYTSKLKVKRGWETYQLIYSRDLTPEQVEEYNANRPKEDLTEPALIIDFYRRFILRMEHMIEVGRERGYDYISFMGP